MQTVFALSVLLAHQVCPLGRDSFRLGSLFVLARPAWEGGPGGGPGGLISGRVQGVSGGCFGAVLSMDIELIFELLVSSF